MAVTARNAWNVARHAAPARGAKPRRDPSPFWSPSHSIPVSLVFLPKPPAQTANQAVLERAKIAPPKSSFFSFSSFISNLRNVRSLDV